MRSIPTAKGYSRLDAFPLDDSSIFATLQEAENYAISSPLKYALQIIGVLETDDVYVITTRGLLVSLTDSADGA